jgi:hypothetical protein
VSGISELARTKQTARKIAEEGGKEPMKSVEEEKKSEEGKESKEKEVEDIKEYEDEPPSGLKDLIDSRWYLEEGGKVVVEPVVAGEIEVQDERAIVIEADSLFRSRVYGSQKKPCLIMKGYLLHRDNYELWSLSGRWKEAAIEKGEFLSGDKNLVQAKSTPLPFFLTTGGTRTPVTRTSYERESGDINRENKGGGGHVGRVYTSSSSVTMKRK